MRERELVRAAYLSQYYVKVKKKLKQKRSAKSTYVLCLTRVGFVILRTPFSKVKLPFSYKTMEILHTYPSWCLNEPLVKFQ